MFVKGADNCTAMVSKKFVGLPLGEVNGAAI